MFITFYLFLLLWGRFCYYEHPTTYFLLPLFIHFIILLTWHVFCCSSWIGFYFHFHGYFYYLECDFVVTIFMTYFTISFLFSYFFFIRCIFYYASLIICVFFFILFHVLLLLFWPWMRLCYYFYDIFTTLFKPLFYASGKVCILLLLLDYLRVWSFYAFLLPFRLLPVFIVNQILITLMLPNFYNPELLSMSLFITHFYYSLYCPYFYCPTLYYPLYYRQAFVIYLSLYLSSID